MFGSQEAPAAIFAGQVALAAIFNGLVVAGGHLCRPSTDHFPARGLVRRAVASKAGSGVGRRLRGAPDFNTKRQKCNVQTAEPRWDGSVVMFHQDEEQKPQTWTEPAPGSVSKSSDDSRHLPYLVVDDGNKHNDLTAAHGHWPADLQRVDQSQAALVMYSLQRRLRLAEEAGLRGRPATVPYFTRRTDRRNGPGGSALAPVSLAAASGPAPAALRWGSLLRGRAANAARVYRGPPAVSAAPPVGVGPRRPADRPTDREGRKARGKKGSGAANRREPETFPLENKPNAITAAGLPSICFSLDVWSSRQLVTSRRSSSSPCRHISSSFPCPAVALRDGRVDVRLLRGPSSATSLWQLIDTFPPRLVCGRGNRPGDHGPREGWGGCQSSACTVNPVISRFRLGERISKRPCVRARGLVAPQHGLRCRGVKLVVIVVLRGLDTAPSG
ncbi:unnamed protein product [Menidia menidia]|uniref:(Atlantic silverside) hypothetical protein n=1 Tax=Menidia menidia TaxID=238744 RepID=A0A8S4ALN7_9TELE|nr:unnamed protein product [Menidia menidia]